MVHYHAILMYIFSGSRPQNVATTWVLGIRHFILRLVEVHFLVLRPVFLVMYATAFITHLVISIQFSGVAEKIYLFQTVDGNNCEKNDADIF